MAALARGAADSTSSPASPATANWWRKRTQPMLKIGRANVPLPPGAFLQATAEGEATLARLVIDHVGKAKRVADLFSGIGPFALRLAEARARHRRRQRCERDRSAQARGRNRQRAEAGRQRRRATCSAARSWRAN